MTDLTTQTPLEIDTEIAALQGRLYDLDPKQRSVRESIMYAADAKRLYGRGAARWNMDFYDALERVEAKSTDESLMGYDRDQAARLVERYNALEDEATEIRGEITMRNNEFNRRGGWTRAFLVTDGHVHSSQSCSTCNNGEYPTQFTWLVEFTDKDEAEVIEAAKERACTVCYPNAPVNPTGKSTLMTPDERTREQQRKDAETARAERSRLRIAKGLTEDGSEFVVSYPSTQYRYVPNPADGGRTQVREEYLGERRESFKTEQAAVSWLVQYTIWDAGRTDEKAPAFEAIRGAVADKHDMSSAEVDAMIEKKIAAKKKRDGIA